MNEKRALSVEAIAKFTGHSPPGTFMRSCYVVRNHGDGTGTVALDWYEMSDGRDFYSSDEFMRTELEAALQIVRLLNAQMPGAVHAAEQIDWPEDD